MSGINVSPEEIQRIANNLRGSTDGLDDASKHPVGEVNAGKSTPELQAVISTLLRASAGLLDGTIRTADKVAAGGTDYTSTDEEAAENMPREAGGN